MTERDEAALVLLAQAGDRAALGALLEGVQPRLRRYLRLLTRDEARADDALQDAFVVAVRKLTFLRDPRAFRAWIYRIATREARRGGRGPAAGPDPDALDAGVDVEREVMTAEASALLRERVEELPAKSRAVIALHYFEEMPLDAIAAILDVPVGTVKSRLAYGLAKLRENGVDR